MADIIYTLKGLTKTFPSGKQVLKNIYLSFYAGAKIGILGFNGSGKSTLLKIIAGVDQDFQGEAFAKDGTKIGYLAQEPQLDYSLTVKENVLLGAKATNDLLIKFNEISEKFAEPMSDDEMNKLLESQSRLQEQIDAKDAWNLDHKINMAMSSLNCPPGDWNVEKLSGGEKRRVALCQLLIQQPDILLLDEPTNHLDAESVHWLEQHLDDYPGTVVAITHDRYFLDNVASWILEIDRGEGIPWQGNYSSWLEQKQKKLAIEEKQETKRQKNLQKELEWIRQSPKARQAKSKARISSYENLASQANREKIAELELYIPPGPRLGNKVIEVNGVSKSFGEKTLFKNLNFSVPPGAIVGIIGANGMGKTSLFRMITGNDKPDTGSIEVGETVKLAYVDQSRDDLDPKKTIFEVLSGGEDVINIGGKEINARQYVARFNFKGPDQQKIVGTLSGGERNRVHLAKILQSESNVLLLDEPTNDLDVNTLRALEEAVLNFSGCVLVISHDRWFLDRIATHILAFESPENIYWFEGNFQDYEANKSKRVGEDTVNKKAKYKKLEVIR